MGLSPGKSKAFPSIAHCCWWETHHPSCSRQGCRGTEQSVQWQPWAFPGSTTIRWPQALLNCSPIFHSLALFSSLTLAIIHFIIFHKGPSSPMFTIGILPFSQIPGLPLTHLTTPTEINPPFLSQLRNWMSLHLSLFLTRPQHLKRQNFAFAQSIHHGAPVAYRHSINLINESTGSI